MDYLSPSPDENANNLLPKYLIFTWKPQSFMIPPKVGIGSTRSIKGDATNHSLPHV